jgi:hypothetical protein
VEFVEKMIFQNFFRGKLQFFPTFLGGKFSAEFSLEKMYEKSASDWASVYFWQVFITKESQSLRLLFPRKKLCMNIDKKCWATFLVDFFANSSGHPGLEVCC